MPSTGLGKDSNSNPTNSNIVPHLNLSEEGQQTDNLTPPEDSQR